MDAQATISIRDLRKRLRTDYLLLRKWEAVAEKWTKERGERYGIKFSRGLMYRIAKERNYEPKEPHIRQALGLPAYTQAPVCAKCGKLHLKERCELDTKKPWSQRPIQDQPAFLLKWRLENRVAFDEDPNIDLSFFPPITLLV